MSLLSGLPAVVASKAVVGFTVATLAVAGAGAVTATAATGSPNPAVWGKTVTDAVTSCRNDLKDGVHGIGPCVSTVAKRNGKQESGQHSASSARSASSAASSHPTGPPTSHPTAPAHP
jgi:cytochrome c2